MLLDDFMAQYNFRERHRIEIAASPEVVYRAIKEVTAAEIAGFGLLMGIRTLPARLLSRSKSQRSSQPIMAAMLKNGFVQLAEAEGQEMVVGTIGQFWKLSGGSTPKVTANEFVAFAEPDFAKATMNFRLRALPGRTLVSTETRIQITDKGSRRKFGLYWKVIAPGSALIRLMWLRAIKRRAERTASGLTLQSRSV